MLGSNGSNRVQLERDQTKNAAFWSWESAAATAGRKAQRGATKRRGGN
jgi:hypothetical protein